MCNPIPCGYSVRGYEMDSELVYLSMICSKRMKLYISVLCGIIVIGAQAQGNYFKVDTVVSGKNNFPVLSTVKNAQACRKINQYMQISELRLFSNNQKKDLFDKNKTSARNNDGKIIAGFTIQSNSNKVFSLSFSETSYWHSSSWKLALYNFNSATGDLIELPDLFTDEGFMQFKKIVLDKRTKTIDGISDSDKPSHNYWDYVKENFKNDDLTHFSISDSTINIDSYNCLRGPDFMFMHADINAKLNLASFKNLLNDYGKAVFGVSKEPVGKYHSKSVTQLYEGKIGDKGEIVLAIINATDGPDHNEVTGVYAYNKDGVGIYLDGIIQKDSLHLMETTIDDKGEGSIDAQILNGQITGKWTSKAKDAVYKFEAKKVD